ncbi:MAG TPA: FG-GAP-like repeat-containing protein [Thermoanaerobaculia bacterium]|nr:FG-GAP-like repeat-containing protein [Thermoanaerobaculia bacterium]
MKKVLLLTLAALFASSLAAAPCPSLQWSTTGQFTETGEVGSLLAVDVDKDGKVDLFSHEAVDSGPLLLRRGKGDGTFHPPATIMATEIDSPMAVGDVNGDGKLDFVGARGNGLRVKLGNGNGTFGPTSYVWPGYLYPQDLKLANFDADPALELAFRSNGNTEGFFAIFDNSDGLGNFVETRRVNTGGWSSAMDAADFDGDGLMDIVVTAQAPRTASVYFGKADGSFTAPLVLAAGTSPAHIAAGDVNGDGRPDLAVSNWEDESVKVYRYTGTRQFTSATTYALRVAGRIGSAHELALRDVNGDGHLDLMVVISNSYLATLIGVGNGTFRSPLYSPLDISYGKLELADFDNDGKDDVVIARDGYLVLESACEATMELRAADYWFKDTEDAIFEAVVPGIAPGGPFGTVTLYEGATSHGTVDVDNKGKARFAVSGLTPAMEHTLTAQFSGNAELPAMGSNSAKVIIQSTRTETIVHLPSYPSKHGQPWPIEIEIVGAGPYGHQVWVTYDGKDSLHHTSSPFYVYPATGTHTISAAYPGTTYPPSESATLTFVTEKAPSFVWHSAGSKVIRAGTSQALDFEVEGSDAAGTLALYEGNTFLASGPIANGAARIVVPQQLPRGLHAVRVVYPGDTHYHPSELHLTLEVIANHPLAIEARGFPSAVHIAYAAPTNANLDSLRLYRRAAGTTSWQPISWWYYGPGIDSDSLQRGVVYEYRLQGTTNTGANIVSNVDAAMLFNDEPLAAGLIVQRMHLLELRAAVNITRTAAGLAVFDYASPLDVIRASHITTLRTALTQARTALGMTTPAFAPLAAGATIKTTELQQLRELAW